MSNDFAIWAAELAEVDTMTCICGHPEEFHTHYRAGMDCGQCGKTVCPAYRTPRSITIQVRIGWGLVVIGLLVFWLGVGWLAGTAMQWIGGH